MTEVWSILRQHLLAEIQTKMHNKTDANTLLEKLNFSSSVDQLENYSVVFGQIVKDNIPDQIENRLRELERKIVNFSPVAEICSSTEDVVLRLMLQIGLKIPADFINRVL